MSNVLTRSESSNICLRLPDQLRSVQRHQPQQVLFARQHLQNIVKPCSVEVKAAPRSQIFCEPISRNVGSIETRSASLTSS